jgi:TolB-like protein/class 3 adenylate cyclase/Tfp pilus assembly protein PilF
MTARRLAAILAADIVGYSRLMGEDEAGTAKIVRERREAAIPIVRAFAGRLVKTTGDGALVEFPSVVAAVECAILMQKMMGERNAALPEAKRIVYRIGVNLGDILIEGDDILGDGVNVAARLEGICEPGGVCVSGSAFEHVQSRIAAEFADLGEQRLKNIAKPVRAYALSPEAVASAKVEAPEIVGAAPAPSVAQSDAREPPRLSLVVLPFANIGGDASQDYFVDGVTESLTTDLSRIAGAFVIGRSTAFTYKGKAADLKQIGRELNVRYVLEGSVQRSGNRMRVNVQLIEAETGAHLWAERFDKPVADLFDTQDEIVSRLANRLGQELARAEAGRAERSADPDSMDHYFLGLAHLNKGPAADVLDKARSHFDRALELDPNNVGALVCRARTDLWLVGNWLSEDRQERLRSAEADLRQALKFRPDDANAHCSLGVLRMQSNRAVQGIAECERALSIDRNLAFAHAMIGMGKYLAGRSEETEAHILEALRISPRDTSAWSWMYIAGAANFYAGCDEEAVAWLNRSVESNPNVPAPQLWLGGALALLGRLEDAREAARAGLELDPRFTIARFRAMPFSDHPAYLAGRERVYEGMRLAGVREE